MTLKLTIESGKLTVQSGILTTESGTLTVQSVTYFRHKSYTARATGRFFLNLILQEVRDNT